MMKPPTPEDFVKILQEVKVLSPAATPEAYAALSRAIVENVHTLLELIPKDRPPDDWMIAMITLGAVFRKTGPKPIHDAGEKIAHLCVVNGLTVIERDKN